MLNAGFGPLLLPRWHRNKKEPTGTQTGSIPGAGPPSFAWSAPSQWNLKLALPGHSRRRWAPLKASLGGAANEPKPPPPGLIGALGLWKGGEE